MREDGSVEQYISDLTMTDTATQEIRSGEASVNHPLSVFGMKCYQNSTGWAATLEIWNGDVKEQEVLLCVGEYTTVESRDGLAIVFSNFYPDYVQDSDGQPKTASSDLNNPAYLYKLYYHDQMLGMNVLKADERITVEDYSFVFTNPQRYTLIQIKSDPFGWLAALGGLMILVSLILAFYLRTDELWAEQQEDGSWYVAGRSRKGGKLFQDELRRLGAEYEKGQ
jgi:cytochrome c biogenesis protein